MGIFPDVKLFKIDQAVTIGRRGVSKNGFFVDLMPDS
jgi:hypothetical protein